ncbi:MAG: helix-hairpin-helix domain-containing protein, partial [Thioalkalispiraceae bacterium]
NADSFVRCVYDKDTAALTKLPGVGKKTAERLIIEMRDRLKDMEIGPATVTASTVTPVTGDSDVMQDAISALVSLGYKPQEASRLLQHVEIHGQTSEAIIKSALKVAATTG